MKGQTLIMGVLNVTPDSFSDGGAFLEVEAALKRVENMLKEGMDILDVGGESARPGHEKVTVEEEWQRIEEIIRKTHESWPALPISVDTWKPWIARKALAAGATWINDIWGGRKSIFSPEDPDAAGMPETMAEAGCSVILMHNRPQAVYQSFWEELMEDFREMVQRVKEAGVKSENIWLDPGFGFGKTAAHNLEVLKHLDRIVALGFPVLLGTSRKSTIGKVLNRTVQQRQWGTAATTAWGIAKGCQMVRVHDIAEMTEVARMCDGIKEGIQWEEKEHG